VPGPGSAPRQADAHEASRSLAPDISPDEALSALQKILDSPTFRNAARHKRFLDFIVRKAVAGDGDQIKEYVVGLEVFDRPPDFDPRSDPMVRAEARRLRVRLADYYSGEGRADPVVIDLPKGTYVPAFARVDQEMPQGGPGAPTKARFWHSKVLIVTAAVVAVTVIAVIVFVRFRARSRVAKISDSIAVLPFVNLSDQPGRQYLGDGVAEELTTQLAQLKGLRVVAATSAFQFRGKGEDVRRIGKQLNAGAILEGSIGGWPGRLRINAQLVSARDGYHLWSKAYEVDSDGVFNAEADIVRETALALRLPADAGHQLHTSGRETTNPEAHDLYLQARYCANKGDPPEMKRAVALLQAAIQKDPNFALAYADLAQVLAVMVGNNQVPRKEVVPLARAALNRALELDPGLAEPYTTQALVKAEEMGLRADMEPDLRRAIALNPNYSVAHDWLGMILIAQKRFAESETELRSAQLLDPLDPMITEGLGEDYYYWRRYDDAIAQLEKLRDRGVTAAYPTLALAYIQKGRYQEALHLNQDLQQHDPSPGSLTYLAIAYAAAGDRDDAVRSLQQAMADKDFATPYNAARAYVLLGDKDAAFAWLQQAAQKNDSQFGLITVDPILDPIRSDPRFLALLKQLNMSQ